MAPSEPDVEHQVVKAERYEMAISHMLTHSQDQTAIITVRMVPSDDPNYHLIEVACMAAHCKWWDHWDERKEDWQVT